MLYFSYGSNMSIRRLQARAPSARYVDTATLHRHELRFHKKSRDGSAKCDAHETGDTSHYVIGVVFDIALTDKPELDRLEGLGFGYEEKSINILTATNQTISAYTYYATHIDSSLQPYHWYKHHVLTGAVENRLPANYIEQIYSIASIADPRKERHKLEMAIYLDN